jgi:asparagine synthase (glutamine-hydrolysing)
MCGIAGSVNWGDAASVARMANVQSHRGPDDRGVVFFNEERVGLGHCRLAILDLSAAGHQPMKAAGEGLWIVFNGEIYNCPELRSELEGKGYRFRSATDTEVILQLYAEEGAGCVRRLNGIFAFAILDRRAQRLVLARDHVGVKPLYYFHANGRFFFGSEIKGILASGGYSVEVNWQAVSDYFTYSCVPGPQTIFSGIEQVPPGHTLTLDLRTNRKSLERYWRASESAKWMPELPYEEFKSELRRMLTESVRRQMLSDVPLGIFLSGGVDSTILTGLMAQYSSRPVKTFTLAFVGDGLEAFDEGARARAVARGFSTDHHELTVELRDPAEMLAVITHFDQPFANPTAYLMYLISKHTRPNVTVALCGAGGDELFAGYPRHRAIGLARLFRCVPRPARSIARWALGLLADDNRQMGLRRVREFLDGLDPDFTRQFVNWAYYLNDNEKRELLRRQPRWPMQLPADRFIRQSMSADGAGELGNQVLAAEIETFLPDNVLEYTDKMSMAVGLEVRVPYLDYNLVARSLALPFSAKVKGNRSKIALRQAFADLLPNHQRERKKRGFVAPLGVWMRERLDAYFDRRMTRHTVDRHGIFNWEYIQLMRSKHRSGAADYSYELFSIIMFDAWFRHYVLREAGGLGF